MGCRFSRFEGNGATFLRRLQTMRARRRRPLNDSKKELLSHDEYSISSNALPSPFDEPNGEIKFETHPTKGVGIATIIAPDNYGITNEKSTVNADMKASHVAPIRAVKEDDDDDDDDDERMIGSGPASPSFRIYFKENWEDKHDEIDAGKDHQALKEAVSTVDINPPKDVEKKVNSKKTKRCFRKVLAKRGEATVKNILNMKSCYQDHHHVIIRRPHIS